MPAPPSVTDIVISHQLDSGAVTSTGSIIGVNPASGLVSSVSGAPPITSTGGLDPIIGISPATDATPGSLSAADKTKLDGLAASTISYMPTTSANWPSAPSNIGAALDDLAILFFPSIHAFSSGSPALVAGPAGTSVNIVSGTVTAPTLPQASTWLNQFIILKLNNLSGGTTVHAFSGDTIDGASTYVIAGVYGSVTFYADASGVVLAFPGLS